MLYGDSSYSGEMAWPLSALCSCRFPKLLQAVPSTFLALVVRMTFDLETWRDTSG